MTRVQGRDALLWGARLVITALLLAWVFSNDDVRRGMRPAQFSRPWFLVAAFASSTLTALLGAWRWSVCLRALGCTLPYSAVLRCLLAGNAAGLLSIGQLGADAVRGTLVAKRLPNNKVAIASSIALDHLCAFPAMLILGAILIYQMGIAPSLNRHSATTVAIVAAALVITGVLLELWSPGLHKRLLLTVRDRLNVNGALLAAVIAAPVVLSHYAVFWFAAQAVQLPANPFGVFGAIVVADAIAALPITIAGLGFREKSFELLLQRWYGVAPALSVQASLAGFAVIALTAVIGVLCFPLNDFRAGDAKNLLLNESLAPPTSTNT